MADSPLTLQPLPRTAESLTEKVITGVLDAVHSGQMVPGVLYSVYQVAEEFGVSRSPVREGLLRLADSGLLRFERNRGFRIILPQPHEIAEIFAVRLALELPAVRRVARESSPALIEQLQRQLDDMDRSAAAGNEESFSKQDERLHDLILAAAGNSRARTIISTLRETTRLLGAATADRSRTLADISSEHRPIVDAIMEADSSTAERAMRQHILHTGRLLVEQAAADQGSNQDCNEIWASVID
ncbi:DNA-binding GntR family transcriptional regulator [Rhodococcus wratislaviensis]|uniref:GntR family transcriptional regulator n=1 Tax=Rhodococcus wratislaviensis TaxID=44752 RepID=A0AB38FDU9_RHOWR|nr:GntR family transcriptional regulator [Rhodococcus wratislaviensis]REE75330.1 DNA-binding GntR family transcriptional regulator [Rhodococcus wratislaviensis]SPZ39641.1 GntR family transcriptional regulator [Rhodococcus wratislaviensis]